MNNLIHLNSSFFESYQNSIVKNSDSEALVWYGAHGEKQSRSFHQLNLDVRGAISLIEKHEYFNAALVVILATNIYEHAIFALAAILSGRSLCPINPDDGLTRIKKKLTALQEPYSVWIQESYFNEYKELNGYALKLNENPLALSQTIKFSETKPMILIFTSGSQGESKIVEQLESGLLTNIDALIERHALGPKASLATPLPLFHVNALEFGFFSCLLSGAKFILLEKFLIPQTFKILEAESCWYFSAVPPILKRILDCEKEWSQYNFKYLKYFISAAAPLNVNLVLSVWNKLNMRIIQGYGLSEAINFSSLLPTNLSDDDYLKWMTTFETPSIGTALRGTNMLIMNEHGDVLTEGVRGEICITGPTLMRGYRGDLEKKVFQYSVLHTGDLGYFKEDTSGTRFFFICGRIKEIVKRYGITISLREIDDIVGEFSWLNFDAIAVPFNNDWAGEEVALLVKSAETWTAELEKALTAHLEQNLPPHLRPKLVIRTERSLRTSSGKPCRWQFTQEVQSFQHQALHQKICFVVSRTSV